MTLPNGYKLISTFYSDFSIADRFGADAVKNTYNRALTAWKDDYIYLTELVIVMNIKAWKYDNINQDYSELYCTLYDKAYQYAQDHLHGKELEFFYNTTD